MSRYSLPVALVPGSSNGVFRVSQPPQGAQAGDQTPAALCTLDEHMMSLIRDYKPMSEQELRRHMYGWGATEQTYDQCVQCHNRLMEQKIERGGFESLGYTKPQPGDPNVYTVRVPDSPYVLRMWEGGMDFYGHFCLDFYDTERKTPVNLPAGHSLCGGAPSMFMPPGLNYTPPPPGQYLPPSVRAHMDAWARAPAPAPAPGFGSWERNLGMSSIPEGEEKWSFPERTCLILRRDGRPDFPFQVPSSQQAVFAQAQRGYPH